MSLASAKEQMAAQAAEVENLRITVRTMQRFIEEEVLEQHWRDCLHYAKKKLHAAEKERARLATELDWMQRTAEARAALDPPTLDLRIDATAEDLEADLLAIEVTRSGVPMFGVA